MADGVLLSQLRRGVLQYCVLAELGRGERYGFDLVRTLAAVDGMAITEGTLYPLLARIRRDGLVVTTWRESSAGPPRKYYALTERGREVLVAFVDEWERFRDGVDHLLKGDHGS